MARNFHKKGFGIIEIIVGVAIISVAFFGLMNVAHLSLKVLDTSSNNLKAAFLLQEGMEAVKILRDDGWNNISALNTGDDYFFEFNGSMWQSTTTNIFVDNNFERKFVVEDVARDGNDDIASSGTLDPDTKKITIYVSWLEKSATTTKNISGYITNLF